MNTRVRSALVIAASAALLLTFVGCQQTQEPTPEPPAKRPAPHPAPAPAPAPAPSPMAKAEIQALGNSGVSGTVTFTDTGNGVSVEAHVAGLTPGKHGFHVHQNGDCSGDGTTAGDHFNPAMHEHGGPDSASPHAGDMGNLIAGADGSAMVTMTLQQASLGSGANDLVGKSVIIHAGEDDLTTQPSGNSGARVACGVITMQGGVTGTVLTPAPTGAMSPAPTGATSATGPTGTTGQ